MKQKIALPLVAVSAFGLGAASMAGFLAWTFSSVMKEMNQERPPYKSRYSSKKDDFSSENTED